jgi:hypothetical protein
MHLSYLPENEKDNVCLTESLSWSLLKKSVSGEKLNELDSSSMSGISSSESESFETKDKTKMFVDQKCTFCDKHLTTPKN